MRKILLLLCFLGLVLGLHLQQGGQLTIRHSKEIKSGRYRFQNGQDKYLAFLSRSARVYVTSSEDDPTTVWTVKSYGKFVRIINNDGEYLFSRFVDSSVRIIQNAGTSSHSVWWPQLQQHGMWVIEGYGGLLGVCRGDNACTSFQAQTPPKFLWNIIEVTDPQEQE